MNKLLKQKYMWIVVVMITGISTSICAKGGVELPPIFIAVFGDSVTDAVWADTSLGKPGADQIFGLLTGKALLPIVAAMAKKTTGYPVRAQRYAEQIDRYFGFIKRKSLSAFMGDQSYSLPVRLQTYTHRKTEVFDGAMIAGGYTFADKLLARLDLFLRQHPQHKPPDLILVSFNGMDFIYNLKVEEFDRDVTAFYAKLVREYPKATIVATPLLDVVTVLTSLNDYQAIRPQGFLKGFTCREIYSVVGFGALNGLLLDTSDSVVARDRSQLAEMNQVLADTVDAIQSKSEPFASFEGNIVLTESFVPTDGDWSPFLAADCIHPSINGQKAYSDLLWGSLEDKLDTFTPQPNERMAQVDTLLQ